MNSDPARISEASIGDVASVGIGITGDLVDPVAVSATVGLEASRAWEKGHRYESRSGGTMKKHSGLWVVERRGEDVELVALDLLAVLEPRAAAIRAAAKNAKATVSVGIWWEPEAGQGGFSVSADVLRRLSVLCERVDVYFPG